MDEKHYYIDLDSITTHEKQTLTHNIHPYPAKYIPQIPGSLIDYLCIPTRSVIMDPFCGSGTTLLEAAIRGYDAIGTDSNPIATLISKVKCTLLSKEQCEQITHILSLLDMFDSTNDSAINIPDFPNRDHWFQLNMQKELGYIRNLIDLIDDECTADFLRTAFSAIIVKSSNQESDTRWRAVNKNLSDGFALAAFKKKSTDMLLRMKNLEHYSLGSVTVKTQDSRSVDFIQDASIACAITSPPYMNSFDYYLYHKLRMYWLGYNHYEVQKSEIGSRNKHCDNGNGIDTYVESISQVIAQIYRKLMPKGYLCVVIGDSIYKGELIHMDDIYSQIVHLSGFTMKEVFSFNQRKYTRAFTPNLKTTDKKSHIMIFQKLLKTGDIA